MNLLVLGGTVFLGRHIVREALTAGHKVTTLNRGTHELPEQANVEKLVDDRTKDLDILVGRKFDAVIDTCGYTPEVVRHSAEVLSGAVQLYVFISTISVYGTFTKPRLNESDPITYLTEGAPKQGPEAYGMLKAECEKALLDIIPDKSLIIRPGLIVGPYDPTDRFTYWPARIADGGNILAPGDPDKPNQFIDVRDLSDWIIRLCNLKQTGVFNATGPQDRLSVREFLEQSKNAIRPDATFTWVDDQFLLDEKVQPYVDIPLWIPVSMADYATFRDIDCSKAFRSGLKIRTLKNTVEDTLSWHRERGVEQDKLPGISRQRERELLDKYANARP